MANQFIAQLQETADGFLNALSFFDDEQFNTVPFEGSWTPGQVGEHILLATNGHLSALSGPTKQADRNPEQNVTLVKSIFLNFDIKMQGPDFIQPGSNSKERTQLLAAIKRSMDELVQFAKTHDDLTLICTGFEMPQMGYFSRIEYMWFFTVHTQRHTHQLQKMMAYFPAEAR